MKITDLRVTHVSVPLQQPFRAGRWTQSSIEDVLVEVKTDEGLTGIGFAFLFEPLVARAYAETMRHLRELVVGQDPLNIGGLWTQMWDSVNFPGHSGVAISCIGAVDMALWDLLGKSAGKPLHQLLGSCRSSVPVYATGGSITTTLAELAQEMQGYMDRGFRAVKVKIGRDWALDLERLKVIREVIGPDTSLMVDVNQNWDVKTTLKRAPALDERFDLTWLEEPLPVQNVDGFTEIRRSTTVPIASGETVYTFHGHVDLLRRGAVDVLQPNLQKVGGVTGWRKVAAAAEAFNVPVSSHTFVEFSVSVMAAAANGTTAEFLPWWEDLFHERLVLVDGAAQLPEGPGFGFSFNWDYLKRYTV